MFIGGSFPMPEGAGSVNYVFRLLSGIDDKNYQVFTANELNDSNKEFDKKFHHSIKRSKFVDHVIGKKRKRLNRLSRNIVAIILVAYNIIKYKPRLVFFTELSPLCISYNIAKVFHKFKLGLFTYSEEILISRNKPFYGRLMRSWFQNADTILTVCDYTRYMINDIINVDDKIVKIIPSVPQFNASASKKENKSGRLQLLTVARLEERKGHTDVIKALGRLKDVFNFVYVIVGSGPYEEKIKECIAENNAESFVELRGRLSNEDLIKVYEKSDIFVMPHKELTNGDTEGCPTVFLEAGLFFLPVVGGEAGGVSDAIKDGETGFVCHKGTDELYMNLKKLLSDSELRATLGENGFKYASQFSVFNQSLLFRDCVERLL